jgi:hypothetical protein
MFRLPGRLTNDRAHTTEGLSTVHPTLASITVQELDSDRACRSTSGAPRVFGDSRIITQAAHRGA